MGEEKIKPRQLRISYFCPMTNQAADLKDIASYAKKYGYVFPSSEIYDGLSAVYDYGQNGVALKDNIKRYWWKAMVQLNGDIEGLDAAIFMHPTTWKASGHVDAFNELLIDNRDTQRRYRADWLIENYIAELNAKIGKARDCERADTQLKGCIEQRDRVAERMIAALEKDDLEALRRLITDLGIADPISGSKNWTDVRRFNLMFATQLSASADSSPDLYLRPETAQGAFVNFLNVQKTARQKLPFGIAQIGKAFRNEIVARQFIFRMREFEQMELQYFVRPGEALKYYEEWREKRMRWHLSLGLGPAHYRFRDHDKLAHYADAASDIEFRFPFGFKELEGIHARTDFDLRNHQKYANKKLQFFDPVSNQRHVPHVVETSVGLDRLFLAVFSVALQEETLADGSTRTVLRLPHILAPIQAAILPLVKKDGLPEIARSLFGDLKYDFNVTLDDKDTIGRRYRRQDAVGTPYCITIDHDTRQDQSATLRNRDTMEQERVPLTRIPSLLAERISMKAQLRKL